MRQFGSVYKRLYKGARSTKHNILRFYTLSPIIDLLKQGTVWWVGYVERMGNLVGKPKEEIKSPRNLESNGKDNTTKQI